MSEATAPDRDSTRADLIGPGSFVPDEPRSASDLSEVAGKIQGYRRDGCRFRLRLRAYRGHLAFGATPDGLEIFVLVVLIRLIAGFVPD